MALYKAIMSHILDGRSYSEITTILECSRRDIAKVNNIIKTHNITWERFVELPNSWFDQTFPDRRKRISAEFDEPDFHALAQQLKHNKHLTRLHLWHTYLQHPTSRPGQRKYQYSQFCERLKTYLVAHDLHDVICHLPGQEVYVDWAGDKIPVINHTTGTTAFKASVFIAVCPHSGLMFATATPNQKMPSWINAHVKLLDYLGAVPGCIVPDNAATATYRPKKHRSQRAITDRYATFADFYKVFIAPARPNKPRDKAAVERAVQIVYARIFGYFATTVFYSLDDLNDAIACRLTEINKTLTFADGSTRYQRFVDQELPMMKQLPHERFCDIVFKHPKVDRNWHICCDRHYYSVPFELVGTILTARLTDSVVSIYHGSDLVAEHPRSHQRAYRYTTNPAHGPAGAAEGYDVLTRDELIRWAESFGPATTVVINRLITEHDTNKAQALAMGRKILAELGKKHDKTTLEPACQFVVDHDLAINITVLRRTQSMLAAEQKTARATGSTQPVKPQHVVDLSGIDSDAVLLRSPQHYTQSQEGSDV